MVSDLKYRLSDFGSCVEYSDNDSSSPIDFDSKSNSDPKKPKNSKKKKRKQKFSPEAMAPKKLNLVSAAENDQLV